VEPHAWTQHLPVVQVQSVPLHSLFWGTRPVPHMPWMALFVGVPEVPLVPPLVPLVPPLVPLVPPLVPLLPLELEVSGLSSEEQAATKRGSASANGKSFMGPRRPLGWTAGQRSAVYVEG
jgi:hypothetical protein